MTADGEAGDGPPAELGQQLLLTLVLEQLTHFTLGVQLPALKTGNTGIKPHDVIDSGRQTRKTPLTVALPLNHIPFKPIRTSLQKQILCVHGRRRQHNDTMLFQLLCSEMSFSFGCADPTFFF